jgi:hypothetical protein
VHCSHLAEEYFEVGKQILRGQKAGSVVDGVFAHEACTENNN